jgi:HK97 family phage portal protein
MFGGLLRRGDEGGEERSTINLSRYAHLWSGLGEAYTPVAVSTVSALTHAASNACIDTLASSVSSLPLDALRAVDEVRVPVTPTPSLVRRPSTLVEQDVWLYQLVYSTLTDGNGFGYITGYSQGGYPTGIDLINPDNVGLRSIDGEGRPFVVIDGKRELLYPNGDVWHVPGKFVKPGTPFADSPIERAKGTIGAAIAARDFGSRFFGEGGHPTALVSSDQNLTPEQAEGIKASVQRALRPGSREPLVMGSGLSWEQIQVTPDDSQFIDLQRYCNEEAARFWRVPPAMIYAAVSGQSVTYSNVSQADMAYLKHSLEPHLVRIERALTDLLPRPQFVRFNRSAFLRSDPVTRSEVVDRRLRNSTLTVNEARALEDELPFDDPEFDEPGIPGVDSPPGSAVPAPTQDDTDA